MSIAIVCGDKNPEPWRRALKAVDASLEIQIWPHENDKEQVEFALCWQQPEGALRDYPNLRCICSMGAGIDHLLKDSLLPRHLPVVRIVDPSLAQSMYEYIAAIAMFYLRELDRYQQQKLELSWQPHEQGSMLDMTVAVMGLGELGQYAATRLSRLGFNVIGWSRNKKKLEGIDCYAEDQLNQFLSLADLLVCLLPLTEQTRGILNLGLFRKMPSGARLINVARGEHLVESDLVVALDSGLLRGACLDVFSTEPLPRDHYFWRHDKIVITPHCSSITDPVSVAPQIVRNYRLMQSGGSLRNKVDLLRGY